MSQRPNHRRGEGRHQDNGPTWESHTPNAGCNATHVARGRAKWKRRNARQERRTGRHVSFVPLSSSRERPPIGDVDQEEALDLDSFPNTPSCVSRKEEEFPQEVDGSGDDVDEG